MGCTGGLAASGATWIKEDMLAILRRSFCINETFIHPRRLASKNVRRPEIKDDSICGVDCGLLCQLIIREDRVSRKAHLLQTISRLFDHRARTAHQGDPRFQLRQHVIQKRLHVTCRPGPVVTVRP